MVALVICIHPSTAKAQAAEDRVCRPSLLYDSAGRIFRIESGGSPRVLSGLSGVGASMSKPHASPDGRTIAWVRYAPEEELGPEVWLMDSNGKNRKLLTTGMTGDQPAWSPDGTRVAFTSDRAGNLDIYVIDLDGENLQRLTRHQSTDEYAAWSPDGEHIAFGSLRNGNFDVFVMRSDGSELRQITSSAATDFRPSWSPDGEWIAFSSTRASEAAMRTYNYDIYLMRPDGSDVRRLTHHELLALRPSWSPTGNEIAYQVGGGTDDNSDWEIYTMDLNGGEPLRLTNNAVGDAHPDWNTYQIECRPG
jgi:Tol biopolymer transport system component